MAALANTQQFPNGPVLERGAISFLLGSQAAGSPGKPGAVSGIAGGVSGTGTEFGFGASTPKNELPDTFTLMGIVNPAGSGGTGSFAAVSIGIDISLDGVNWIASGVVLQVSSGEVRFVTGEKFRYIRANVGTLTINAGAPQYALELSF